jgi:hypothetical protein
LLGLSVLLGGCQLIGGIEVRDEYKSPGAAGEGGDAGALDMAGSPGKAGAGGSSAGSSALEGGAAGESNNGGGAAAAGGEGGELTAGAGPGPDAVCGDGIQQSGEACDDGVHNGEADQCDSSCGFVCAGACPLRVDPAIADAGDGSSWEQALSSLQEAVTTQQTAGGGEVWVKQGTIIATGSGVLLTLGSSVEIYGGFAGTELRRAQRPAPSATTVTVLDANKLAYPAVRGAGGALLDGFLIQNASGAGGSGFTATTVTGLVLRSVWFKDNESVGGSHCGGALVLNGGEARLEGCHFEGNTSEGVGGAICLAGTVSTLTIDGSTFLNNHASGSGGAIHAYGSYSPARVPTIHVLGSTFIGNKTTTMSSPGGAVYVTNANLDVSDSDFMANHAELAEGSALYCDSDAKCPIVNSAFVRNEGFRAAVSGNTPDQKVVNSTFAFNDNGCPDGCDVSSQAFLALQNSVMVQSDKSQMFSVTGQAMSFNSCSIFVAGGLGAKPSPFVEPLMDQDGNGVPEYLLAQPADNSCLDAGQDSYAADAGITWDMLTTSANNCLDVSPIDAGRHYRPTTAKPEACQ